MTIETKKLEMQAVETEISNILQSELRMQKFSKETDEERKRLTSQIEALRKLKDALKIQLTNLEV